jgi:hypothetical protein
MVLGDLWLSKQITTDNPSPQNSRKFALSRGTSEGISGVLYVLARIYRAGISIDPCMPGFRKGWETFKNNTLNKLNETPHGLYKGTAGIAIALGEGLRSGLLQDKELYKQKILECLRPKAEGLDIANGIAGQGVAILNCQEFLKNENFNELTEKIIQELLGRQQKDGSWFSSQQSKNTKTVPLFDMAYDDVGIALFLLDYLAVKSNNNVEKTLTKAIHNILQNKRCKEFLNRQVASRNSYEVGDGGKGLLLLLIKAYDFFHENNYRKIALGALLRYPPKIIHPNFTQANGLASMGEIYREAYRVFKNEEWNNRADWIANIYIHTFCRTQDSSGHWVLEQNSLPTADFLTGISGIIHFLARTLYPGKLGYRLFN